MTPRVQLLKLLTHSALERLLPQLPTLRLSQVIPPQLECLAFHPALPALLIILDNNLVSSSSMEATTRLGICVT